MREQTLPQFRASVMFGVFFSLEPQEMTANERRKYAANISQEAMIKQAVLNALDDFGLLDDQRARAMRKTIQTMRSAAARLIDPLWI